ncbi:hypothetical protein FQN50_000028 [Emmonsiellopsis sp. PD_5]|nr:hypothetical protein FQN50_000028 [Emmonsiellopsis sp. PD_5]
MPTPAPAALPYHEPPIPTLLITSTFLLLLNLINHFLDNLIYCGLLGQLFVGVAWGAPGAQWLSIELQEAVVKLGYLGLVLLVYEGGLSTSPPTLRANLPLSTAVAITGILLPIALSFSLRGLMGDITNLQAFAAGAALCSTSLGTTFTVLSTSGLVGTRLGTVLAAGAMMDDVVGLVLVKVIAEIGGGKSGEGDGGVSAVVVVRPVVVSVGCVVVLVGGCRGLGSKWGRRGVRGVMGWVDRLESGSGNRGRVWRWLMLGDGGHMAFIVQTLLLIGFVAAAVYAGTSGLFAAYLAGTFVSWWDCGFGPGVEEEGDGNAGEEVMRNDMERVSGPESPGCIGNESSTDHDDVRITPPTSVRSRSHWTGMEVYERYYSAVVDRVLKPFFFASIGFAIPMKNLFKGHIIWRGIVYTILMLMGKLLTGIWLVRLDFSSSTTAAFFPITPVKRLLRSCSPAWHWCMRKPKEAEKQTPASGAAITRGHDGVDVRANSHAATADATIATEERQPAAPSSPAIPTSGGVKEGRTQQHQQHWDQHDPSNKTSAMTESPLNSKWPRPRSLYPASILGMAMVARGEIGFLISSLAESSGIFAGSGGGDDGQEARAASDIYLVVTWAIMLCTVIGPVTVGMLVRWVKRLQEQHDKVRGHDGGREGVDDPLGIWGVR